MRKIKNNFGFTLVEMAIVMIVIGVMMIAAKQLLTTYTQKRIDAKVREDLVQSAYSYFRYMNQFPGSPFTITMLPSGYTTITRVSATSSDINNKDFAGREYGWILNNNYACNRKNPPLNLELCYDLYCVNSRIIRNIGAIVFSPDQEFIQNVFKKSKLNTSLKIDATTGEASGTLQVPFKGSYKISASSSENVSPVVIDNRFIYFTKDQLWEMMGCNIDSIDTQDVSLPDVIRGQTYYAPIVVPWTGKLNSSYYSSNGEPGPYVCAEVSGEDATIIADSFSFYFSNHNVGTIDVPLLLEGKCMDNQSNWKRVPYNLDFPSAGQALYGMTLTNASNPILPATVANEFFITVYSRDDNTIYVGGNYRVHKKRYPVFIR